MSPGMRLLLAEAWICLAWARLLKSISFSRMAPRLGEYMSETSRLREPSHEILLLQISQAILKVSRHTWWDSQCLVMAIAGMTMLKRRGIPSTLYLGTAKDECGKMIAHAWLRSGNVILTGAKGMERFTVVAAFGKQLPDAQKQRGVGHA